MTDTTEQDFHFDICGRRFTAIDRERGKSGSGALRCVRSSFGCRHGLSITAVANPSLAKLPGPCGAHPHNLPSSCGGENEWENSPVEKNVDQRKAKLTATP